MTKYFCDKCGREQKKELNAVQFCDAVSLGDVHDLAQLCDGCLRELRRFLKSFHRKPK
ncbi:MAG: hypothetical protein KGL39_02870 [Patescibacteria group bacterium]|nr:hypothetical protein [Patescibacteria group bacterium]